MKANTTRKPLIQTDRIEAKEAAKRPEHVLTKWMKASTLCLTALVGMSPSTAQALDVCKGCVVVEATKKFKRVPWQAIRSVPAKCPVGYTLTDTECKKSRSDRYFYFKGPKISSTRGEYPVFTRVGESFQVAARCVVTAQRVRRSVTVTTKASCRPPREGEQVVFSTGAMKRVPFKGFRRQSVDCPKGKIMTHSSCYRGNTLFNDSAKNARFTSVDEFSSTGLSLSVDRLPTGVTCGMQAKSVRKSTHLTAMGVCVDPTAPGLMLDTAEIISINDKSKTFIADCPEDKVLLAHGCNASGNFTQFFFEETIRRATCRFRENALITHATRSSNASMKAFCVDKQSSLL